MAPCGCSVSELPRVAHGVPSQLAPQSEETAATAVAIEARLEDFDSGDAVDAFTSEV